METLPIEVNLDEYNKIIFVTPICIFKMCSPMRDFIIKNKDFLNTKEVDIVFNHFNPWLPKGAINEVKKYINISKVESETTELGHTFKLDRLD